MVLKIGLLIIFFLAATGFVCPAGLMDADPCHRSTEGTDFWFGFMQGRNTNAHFVEITITSREGANYSLYIGKSTTAAYSGSIGPNGTKQIQLNYSEVEPTYSEVVLYMGLHLVTDKPVNLYTYNRDRNSSDVAVMYPLESLGNEYYTMCYKPHPDFNDLNHGRNTEFVVVASQDSTKVTVTPSQATDGLHPAKTPFIVTLNKGELYQVQALNGDLTGSHILSDKPVAVYAGSLSTTIPYEATGGWDHLYEQMPPVTTWGREYYTVPLLGRSKDYFRVMASKDKTSFTYGSTKISLNKGQFYEFYTSTALRIIADQPVLVAQYSQSRNNDNVSNGDGFMVILSPVSQAKNDVTFVAYQSAQMRVYYVNLVVPVSETGNIELAGSMISRNNFRTYSGSRYAYAQIPVNPGPMRLRNAVNADRGFIAYVYGYGGNEAYGYGVGFNLDLVLDLGKSIDFEGDTIPLCQGSTLILDAGPYFDHYLWDSGDTTQEITVTRQGKYALKASTVDGCVQRDSIVVLMSDPKVSIGKDQSGCDPYSVTLKPVRLDSGDEFKSFLWSTGETTSSVIADKTEEFRITAFDKYGCPAYDTMKMTVYAVPNIELAGNQHYCGTQTGKLQVNILGTEEDIWRNGSYNWESDHPAKLTFRNKGFTSAEFDVSDWGNYAIYYTLTTVNGCMVKDTLNAGLFQVPTSVIETRTPGKCGEYAREILYLGNASSGATFHWDYGGLALITDIDWKTKLVSLGEVRSNPFVSLWVEEDGCRSELYRLAVGANPNFTMDTRKSRGCDTATIYFEGKLNIPDKQLHFEWNFGDGSGVSYDQETTRHFYAKAGNYDVTLLITNKVTGCQVGFTMKEMVKIFTTPVAGISVDPSFCYGDTIPVFFTRNVDSSFCYWQFEGARKFGTGNDSIQVILEKPYSKIRLQVDEFGCKSKWEEAIVKRKPGFDFTVDHEKGCQPLEVNLQAVTSDSFLDYLWKADTLEATGDNPLLLLPVPGPVTVTLAAQSHETGCRDELTKKDFILVWPKPSADFVVDYPVALFGQANLNFTDRSLGASQYKWDFNDGGFSGEKNPRHNFTEMGKFLVTLETESESGCLDTASMEIEVLPFDVFAPNAFRPASTIPENRVFMPVSAGVDPLKFHLQIYNRWGEMVFESFSPENSWDGRLKNNREAPVGNYIWQADYTDIQGFRHRQKGQVLLVR